MKHIKHFFVFLYDHLEYIFVVVLVVGVFYFALTQGSYADPGKNRDFLYAEKIFDDSRVHKVEVEIADSDLERLLAAPREREKYRVAVKVDGENFQNVAFSTRGNGSLMELSANEYTNRYSYTLNFRRFDSENSYYGLDKLILNNLYVDSSYLKNYLAFRLAAASGLDMPLSSFTELYINGELKGLYLAIEGVDHSFLARTNASANAALFHPVPYSIDHNRIYQESKSLQPGETGPWDDGPGFNGSDLKYAGLNIEAYDAIFSNATTKYSEADKRLIVDAIRSLEPSELFSSPENYWDIDSIINFFVAATLAPNGDSYVGITAQNYYLKLSDGKLSLIPWDNDRAFHIGDLAEGINDQDGAVLWPIDTPLMITIRNEDRPLWRLIVDNPEYFTKYHGRLQETLNSYLINGNCRRDFDEAVNLIRDYVYNDPTRFCSTDDFEAETEYLRRYILLRTDSIQKQLWGLQPTVKDAYQSENLDLSNFSTYSNSDSSPAFGDLWF